MSDPSDAAVSNPDARRGRHPLLTVEDTVAADDEIKLAIPKPEPPIRAAEQKNGH
jgi:hypothetical protein